MLLQYLHPCFYILLIMICSMLLVFSSVSAPVVLPDISRTAYQSLDVLLTSVDAYPVRISSSSARLKIYSMISFAVVHAFPEENELGILTATAYCGSSAGA